MEGAKPGAIRQKMTILLCAVVILALGVSRLSFTLIAADEMEEAGNRLDGALIIGLLLGALGAWALSRYIEKRMLELEASAIPRLLEERQAMLQSIREGVLAIDRSARITLVNEEAARILNIAGIQEDLIGKPVYENVANSRLREVLESGQAEFNQEQEINGIVVLTNRVPVKVSGQIVGAIATFRDKTEIRQLAEELTGARNYADALRAQTHEFMNKLHVILGMVNLKCYDDLQAYITGITKQFQIEVGFLARRIKDPVLAGFLLGKISRAREMGIELILTEESYLPRPLTDEITHELITIAGNLIDNAIEAVGQSAVKRVEITFTYQNGRLLLDIADTGPGIPASLQNHIFDRGCSTKALDRGLGLFLARNSVLKCKGFITAISTAENGTRFCVNIPYQTGDETG